MSDKEGYTAIPHGLMDRICRLPNAGRGIALVICRHTLGWQRTSADISVRQFMDATDMSRQTVLNGIQECLDDGIIARRPSGYNRGWIYEVVYKLDYFASDDDDTSSPETRPQVVQKLDHLPAEDDSEWSNNQTTSGLETRLPVVYKLDHLTSDLAHQDAPNEEAKERSKESIKKHVDFAHSAPHASDDETEPTPLAVRRALASGCDIDLAHCTDKQRAQVNVAALAIWQQREPDQTPDDFVKRLRKVGKWIRKTQHPYATNKEQQMPPSAISKHWLAGVRATSRTHSEPHANGLVLVPPVASTPEDTAALLADLTIPTKDTP